MIDPHRFRRQYLIYRPAPGGPEPFETFTYYSGRIDFTLNDAIRDFFRDHPHLRDKGLLIAPMVRRKGFGPGPSECPGEPVPMEPRTSVGSVRSG